MHNFNYIYENKTIKKIAQNGKCFEDGKYINTNVKYGQSKTSKSQSMYHNHKRMCRTLMPK